MPELHETMMGRKFYEADVPDLVSSLKNIAKSLKEIAESLKKEEDE